MANSLEAELDRRAYCLFGILVDEISMSEVVTMVTGARGLYRTLISTANVNFLVSSQFDPHFRETLRTSDLCTIDGAALAWLARRVRIPIRERVAGSDLFDALVARTAGADPLRVFFFGGDAGVAEEAARSLAREGIGVTCVGYLDPGRGSVEELSGESVIETINASGADFLVVALGAVKGQSWLAHNAERITVPLRSHLGAVLAFRAGRVRRAPPSWRARGVEWLWRIKEEPHLWKRYAWDGLCLSGIVAFRLAPLALLDVLAPPRGHGIALRGSSLDEGRCRLVLEGDARLGGVEALLVTLKNTLVHATSLVIDLAHVRCLDARTAGLLFVIRNAMRARGGSMTLAGIGPLARLSLSLHGASDLADAAGAGTEKAIR